MAQASRKKKITKAVVDRVESPEAGYIFVRDTEIRGFGLRVTSNGAKSFIFERRVQGRVKRYTLGRYGPDFTVEQARKKAKKYGGEIADGKDPGEERAREVAENITFGEALDSYLSTRKLKPSTVTDVTEAMKGLVAWKKRRLADIGPDKVLAKHRELSKASKARANLTMRYFRAIWNFARAKFKTPDGTPIFKDNPAVALSELKAWNRVDRRQSIIKRDQLRPWMEAVAGLQGSQSRHLLTVLVFTGLRKGEALGLRWEDVDFSEQTLTVRDTKTRKDHSLPMGRHLSDVLQERRASVPQECPWVFGDAKGKPLADPRGAMAVVIQKSGVEFCLHDLRRTFATIAETLDVSPYTIKRLLGHSTATDVTAGYLVLDTERLRGAMQKIEDTILRHGGVRGGGDVVEFPGAEASQ